MQTIFFLKTAKAEPTASNSIVLRFKLVETGKPKVKGLGISCAKKDWNQDDQQVRRSHPQYKKHNDQLKFISSSLTEIEKERNVNAEDIDMIVEASIKGLSVKEIEDRSNLLTAMLQMLYEVRSDSTFSDDAKNIPLLLKGIVEKFEIAYKYQITAEGLNKKNLLIQNDLVSHFRKLELKDSSIKAYLVVFNTAIRYFKKITGKEVKPFTIKDTKWEKRTKQPVALTTEELGIVYNFVFKPKEHHPTPTKAEARNLKLFLFRCFSGMRIVDMNKKNINQDSLTASTNVFSYFQDKGVKTSTVFCIGSYLYEIAEALNWEFPDFSETSKKSYEKWETATIRKYLKVLLKDNMRKIQHITETGYVYKNLSEEVTTHTARKTFAHLLYSLTKDIMLVKNQLGHTKIETTMRYLDFNMDGNSDMLKKVNLGF